MINYTPLLALLDFEIGIAVVYFVFLAAKIMEVLEIVIKDSKDE